MKEKKDYRMKVITLAAGLGTRLKPAMNKPIPKALLSIGSETILERQIRQLPLDGVSEHLAVVGQQGDCWNEESIDKFKSLVDKVIINERNAETEAAYSFLLCLDSFSSNEDVLVIDGDIIAENGLLGLVQKNEAKNVALVKATETKIGFNNGACIKYGNKKQIIQCGFNVRSNYVYSGVLHLSEPTIRFLREKNNKRYEKEQLASLIDEIAKEDFLTGFTVNPRKLRNSVVDTPLDGYKGSGKTIIDKRKGKIIKSAVNEPKKLRNEIEQLQKSYSCYPEHFPELHGISFFSKKPSYEMPDYTQKGYTPLDEIIRSKMSPNKVSELASPPLEFILKDYGNKTETLPSLFRNSFLPKIRTRYESLDKREKYIESIVEAEYIVINGRRFIGLPKVIEVLERGSELIGYLEPPFMKEVHGDFKPDNILIDQKTGDFILIDPRGRSEVGTMTHDPLYDIAKFLTSTKGYYIALKNGDFNCSIDTEPTVSVDYEIYGNTDSFENLTKTALEKIDESAQKEDENYKLRLKFLTALLLISNAPVHTIENNNVYMSILELSRGLEIFNEVLQEFESRVEHTADLININTKSDFKKARRIFYE
ncbi:sugar phosphate nucleotidyltransferase [Methanonatronarchaeum sp. AMET6-2]|uniref:sugar phosphate nucleotidyltransferase n=1 Tax=Methanonatronarchaeum sp. AMET6-2 TaxID=2933293 RepID=UPI001FF35E5C|nr:sugar phosphate nucleotidyltransferase [Methanonatronarchaeum sp. AMET6-2]UOY10286.1 sugar phosphate nucleotidyltransferase [Methanonatronarchaeum sp. AMET6-2]